MPSLDVVCTIDLQEVDNAINQTLREIGQRFDFKNTRTEVRRDEGGVLLASAEEFKVRAVGEILREKLARRGVPLRGLTAGPIEPGPAGTAKQTMTIQQGIPIEKAREIVKLVKETKLKVAVAIQGDQVRVSGKKRDDLQAVIRLLKESDLGIAMQFVNFRD